MCIYNPFDPIVFLCFWRFLAVVLFNLRGWKRQTGAKQHCAKKKNVQSLWFPKGSTWQHESLDNMRWSAMTSWDPSKDVASSCFLQSSPDPHPRASKAPVRVTWAPTGSVSTSSAARHTVGRPAAAWRVSNATSGMIRIRRGCRWCISRSGFWMSSANSYRSTI